MNTPEEHLHTAADSEGMVREELSCILQLTYRYAGRETMLSQIRLFTDVVQCPPREPELINNYYHRVAAEDADNAAGRAATLVMSN
jgi:hypothetical protein